MAALLIVAGSVVKYAVPNRRLKTTGIPASTTWFGVAARRGRLLRHPGDRPLHRLRARVHLAEYCRVGGAAAWPSTKERCCRRRQYPHRARGRQVAALVWVAGVVAT